MQRTPEKRGLPITFRRFVVLASLVAYAMTVYNEMDVKLSNHYAETDAEYKMLFTESSQALEKKWPPPVRAYPLEDSDNSTKVCGWDYYELVEGTKERAHVPYCRLV